MSEVGGSVFDIQRFSLHDGPGIRTLVFLKGCPLSCIWCCNPESQKEDPQIGYNPQKCISCNACIEVCPYDAVSLEGGERLFSMKICDACREQPCVEACPSGAIERFGKFMTLGEVMGEVRRDEPFYRKSGGGVTVSGGEPMAQADFTAAILKACRELGYSTAVETSGFCDWEEFEKIIGLTDLFLYDLKHMDSQKHLRFIGQENSRILENLTRLRRLSLNIIVRLPLVPGFNGDRDSLTAVADFSRNLGITEIHILPYHRLGRSKYSRLFRDYAAENIGIPTEEEIAAAPADYRIKAHKCPDRWIGENGMGVSKRGEALKAQVVGCTPSISSERAEIVTRCYKELEREDTLVRRARVLEAVLEQKSIYILEGELIVGNQAPSPRAAEVFPEFSTRWILSELDSFSVRDSDVFTIDDETKTKLREILPWWKGRSVQDKALDLLPAEAGAANSELVYILTSFSSGIGHIAVDYERCIRYGLRRIIEQAKESEQSAASGGPDQLEKRSFYRAVQIVCEALISFAHRFARHAAELAESEKDPERRAELETISRVCSRVPEFPAESFREALQAFWFVHLVLQIESNGHSISPGRFDQVRFSVPWYRRDLDSGRLTRAEARELLENLWIKMNELMKLRDKTGSKAFGGYPLFQNLIVGGVDREGKDAANELSYLCMEVTRELKLPQPSLSVRWHTGTGHRFMAEAASVVKAGFGMPAFFNDEGYRSNDA